jgi:hypothetical protein
MAHSCHEDDGEAADPTGSCRFFVEDAGGKMAWREPLDRRYATDAVVNARHFVMTCFVGVTAGGGAAGEITNVTHAFQPSGRFSAANSL